MQILVISDEKHKSLDTYCLYQFASSIRTSIISGNIIDIDTTHSALFLSKGKHNFIELERKIELFPSFFVTSASDEQINKDKKFQKLEQTLLRGHPYCQQILFKSDKINTFFDEYISLNNINDSLQSGEAYIHIASLKEFLVFVHKIKLPDEDAQYTQDDISKQLKYEFSKVYNAMISSIEVSEQNRVDKSVCIKVNFTINSKIDLSLSISSIKVIGLDNFNYEHQFNQLLSLMLNDLLDIKISRNASLGSNNDNYMKVCRELGIYCEPIARNMYYLQNKNNKAVYIPYHRTVQSKTSIDAAESKVKTNEILQKNGFNVSNHITIPLSKIDDEFTSQVFDKLKLPFVIKPTDQSAGYGVFLNINSKELFNDVIEKLKNLDKINDLIIEEQFEGTLYRFIVIGDKVEAVLKATYPVICGDGKSSVADLIKQYNKIHIRKTRIDDSTSLYFASLGITTQTVLEKGKTVVISLKKNGDVTQDVTSFVNKKFNKIAVDVNNAIGLKIDGVDMMISDSEDYRIIELNPVPALYPHLAPNHGVSRNLFKKVIEYTLQNVSNRLYNCTDIYSFHS